MKHQFAEIAKRAAKKEDADSVRKINPISYIINQLIVEQTTAHNANTYIFTKKQNLLIFLTC